MIVRRSHCVSTQDVIVSICGLDTKGMKKKDVKRLLKETESLIELKLEYEIQDTCFSKFGIYRPERISLKLKKEFDSFGFVLRKNCLTQAPSSGYPVFSNIRDGSPADRGNILKAGDRLIQIDGQNVEWLSLLEVADILKEKDEATFLVEYNIAIVGASCLRRGERSCLEIACPGTDLGVVLGFFRSTIIIEDIRKGSLAERCGALHVGDEILAINDIDANFLTPSRANILLQNFKKDPGKLIFIPHMDKSRCNRQEIFDRRREPKAQVNRSSHHSITEDDQMVPPSINSLPSDCQTSSDRSLSANNEPVKIEINRHFYEFQMENVCLVRDVVQNVTELQNFMEFLGHSETYTQTELSNVSEISNNPKQNFVKIEFGKLMHLKDLCSRTKTSTRSITMHLVRTPDFFSCRHDGIKCDKVKSFNKHCSRSDLEIASKNHPVQELVKNLIEIRLRKFISKRNLEIFTSKCCRISLACRECYEMCMSAVFKTQKVLLILSLDDRGKDIWLTTNKLMKDISTMKMPCNDCKILHHSTTQVGLETVRNNAFPSPLHKKPDIYKFTWDIHSRPSYSNSRTGSASSKMMENTPNDSNDENLSKFDEREHVSLNTAKQSAFFIQNQTPSPELPSRSSLNGSSDSLQSLRVPNNSLNSCSQLQLSENVSDCEKSDISGNYNYNVQNKIHKGKGSLKVTKNCKSAEVISETNQKNQFSVPKHSSIPSHLDKNFQSTSDKFAGCTSPSENTSLKEIRNEVTETVLDNLNMTSNSNRTIFTMSDIANVQNNIERLSDKSNFYSFSHSKQANSSRCLKSK
ncbi:glutamate receptor-interacting protein 1 [Trichonephila clavipes]|nr:glutamate receptor-interacting protein 1 [Trichonephila clavipes]